MTRPLKFLIVDDDSDGRFLTRIALQNAFEGCRVVEAVGIEEALAQVGEICPDAVLTACRIGPENGADLIARVRAMGGGCVVILLTGTLDPYVHRRALNAGADCVFLNWELEYVTYLGKMLCVAAKNGS